MVVATHEAARSLIPTDELVDVHSLASEVVKAGLVWTVVMLGASDVWPLGTVHVFHANWNALHVVLQEVDPRRRIE